MAQCMGYLLVACRGPAVKSRGQGRVSCTDTSPQSDLSIWVPYSFVIDCVCWVVWACLNVLCWHGPLLERSLSRARLGGFLLARGVVRTPLATVTVLESTAGMFLRIRSDIEAKMPPRRAPRGPALTFSACLGQLWDNLAKFGFLGAIWPRYLTVFTRTCPSIRLVNLSAT